MNRKIAILDYGVGNIRSVFNAVNHVGFEPVLLNEASRIANYGHVIVPGVGNFGHVVKEFEQFGFKKAIQDFVASGNYCLGICVGMQMLFDNSEESPDVPGLGIISGDVVKMANVNQDGSHLKLPHIGWRALQKNTETSLSKTLFKRIKDDATFYFVHSFTAKLESKNNLNASVSYGDNLIAAMVSESNVVGTQFHPERSGTSGLQMIQNFCDLR